MTRYFFKSLFSDNRFKLQLVLCLSLLFFMGINAQDLTVSGAVSAESELSIPNALVIIERTKTGTTINFPSNHNLFGEASNSMFEFPYLGLNAPEISSNGRSNMVCFINLNNSITNHKIIYSI